MPRQFLPTILFLDQEGLVPVAYLEIIGPAVDKSPNVPLTTDVSQTKEAEIVCKQSNFTNIAFVMIKTF